MGKHCFYIDVKDAELDAIFKRLEKAREEIYDCYDELRDLNIINIGNSDNDKVSNIKD